MRPLPKRDPNPSPPVDNLPRWPAPAPARNPWHPIVLVFLPFASGYYLSYLFRTINALIAHPLAAEFHLRPADLGLLTSAYFLGFGLSQLPFGSLLDRYGPRRVQSAFLLLAAAGAAVFAAASGLTALMAGRTLIGLGVAGALMAGLKAITIWFPKERIALANGWFIMLGALGAVSATVPAEMLLAQIGWRHLFALLAVLSVVSSAVIFVIVPERRAQAAALTAPQPMNLRSIFADAMFWRLAPLSATCIGTAWALQGLWAAPWLADVDRLPQTIIVRHLFVMAVALSAAALGLGVCADRLRRRGVSLNALLMIACGAGLAAQLGLVIQAPGLSYLLWATIGGLGAVTVLSYAILAEAFPPESTGRANGALNLLHVTYAFVVQSTVGVIVQHWTPRDGHYPAIAYQTALAVNLAIQMTALIWFARPARRPAAPTLTAHPLHQAAHRWPHSSPQAVIGYQRAIKTWDAHLNAARLQARWWRLAAIGSVTVAVILTAAVLSASTTIAVAPYPVAAEIE
ncbi:MAG: MFS transporter [Hyphomicrobiaceae bacterium]